MDERKRLYIKLQHQVDAIMPIVDNALQKGNEVFIGKIKISCEDFFKLKESLKEISEKKVDTDEILEIQIPLVLISNNIFFREVQVTLNQLRDKQMEYLFKHETK